MRQKQKYTILLILVVLILGACEKNVDIDIEVIDPMIVMNGVLQVDSTVVIYLSRTRHILDNSEINVLTNATVHITDSEGNSEQLVYGTGQLYRTDQMFIESGKEYTITASAPGYNDAEGTCIIPETVPVVKFDTSTIVNEWGEKMIAFEVVFDDPAGVENFYMLSIRSQVEYANTQYMYYEDTLYVDQEKDTVVVGYVRDSVVFRDVQNQSVWFESEDLAIEQYDYRTNRIIFSDRLFNGRRYSVKGIFNTWFLYGASDTAIVDIHLQSIDNHYFKYINSRVDHYYAKSDPFAVPVVVHNNIQNGLGILGGMSSETTTIKLAPLNYEWNFPYY